MRHSTIGRSLGALAAAIAFSLLAACSTLGLPQPKSPAQTLFELETTYNASLTVFLDYKALPDCDVPMHPILCSNSQVIRSVQMKIDVTSPVLDEAERAVRTPGFGTDRVTTLIAGATSAVAALSRITTNLKVR